MEPYRAQYKYFKPKPGIKYSGPWGNKEHFDEIHETVVVIDHAVVSVEGGSSIEAICYNQRQHNMQAISIYNLTFLERVT